MKAHTSETQATITPARALEVLKEGNARFVSNLRVNRNLLQQADETRDGQWPFATIVSCIDSRTSAELIFDQGLGDIFFSVRIAGNVVNTDIIGSLEFACHLAGSRLVVVLGHTACGAVKGACDHVELGSLTELLSNTSRPSTRSTRPPSRRPAPRRTRRSSKTWPISTCAGRSAPSSTAATSSST